MRTWGSVLAFWDATMRELTPHDLLEMLVKKDWLFIVANDL